MSDQFQPNGTVAVQEQLWGQMWPQADKGQEHRCAVRGEMGISTGLDPASELGAALGSPGSFGRCCWIGCLLALWDSWMGLAELPLLRFHLKFSPELWDVHLCLG